MSDLQKYITKRKKTDKEFAANYDEGFENFKIGVLLRQARESEGITQEEIARKMNTKNRRFRGLKITRKIFAFRP